MNKVSCLYCREVRSVKNFNRHLKTLHENSNIEITLTCKFCNKLCKNLNSLKNHERLCPSNSERNYISHTIGIKAWNKGLTATNDERVANQAAKIAKTRKENPISLTQEQKNHLSSIAKLNGFGGYRENAGRSKKFRVLDSYGKETVLQSSYELLCSNILNELNIKWIRPKAIKYDNKNYFADFYLTEYDIWLDPKNSYKAKQDKEKITKVIEQNNIKLFVLLEHEITKEYIGSLIQR